MSDEAITQDQIRQTHERIARALRMVRAYRGWSQSQVAEKMGWKESNSISVYETGRRVPSQETMIKLCGAYGISLQQVFALSSLDWDSGSYVHIGQEPRG